MSKRDPSSQQSSSSDALGLGDNVTMDGLVNALTKNPGFIEALARKLGIPAEQAQVEHDMCSYRRYCLSPIGIVRYCSCGPDAWNKPLCMGRATVCTECVICETRDSEGRAIWSSRIL